ncbi:MAG: protein kinase [Myxococcota bacterium]|nr:protein kinase [Myxococcota bacterium]MDW8362690.1 protein kinase [Myxococcales bacterium]
MDSVRRELAEGARVGRWRLGRRIAVGGMAEVFEADDEEGRLAPAVVKVLLPHLRADPEVAIAWRHEAELGSVLRGEGLVRVLEHGEEQGQPWMALERVQGGTLAALCAHAGGRLPVPVVVEIGRALLGALEHVHEARAADGTRLEVVHRDVSPDNVLVSREGRIVLGDFGIARSARRPGRTRTGVVKGKLAYISPEQATGSALDARTDLYALGAVLWELATGARWLQADDEPALLRLAEDPPWRPAGALVPEAAVLDPVLERALRRFPEERWPTARAMREALDRLQERLGPARETLARLAAAAFPLPAEGSGKAPMHVEQARSGPARRRWTWRLSVGVALAGVLLPVAWWLQRRVAVGNAAPSVQASPPIASTTQEPNTPVPAPSTERGRGPTAVHATSAPTQLSRPSEATQRSDGPRLEAGAASARPGKGLRLVVQPARGTRGSARDEERSGRTTQTPAPAPEPDTVTETEGADREPHVRELSRRLHEVREGLRRRRIEPLDLDDGDRRLMNDVEAAIGQGDVERSGRLLAELEARVARLRVDAAFVSRKLRRIGALLDRARASRPDAASLDALATAALEAHLDGRHEDANERLEELARRLRSDAP